MASWQWLPFLATLILLTAPQLLDSGQLEASEMGDGANCWNRFLFIVPHISRAPSRW